MNDALSVSVPVALLLTWTMHVSQRILFYFHPHTLVALLITYTDMWMSWVMFEPVKGDVSLVLFASAVAELITVTCLCVGIVPFSFTPYDMIKEQSKALAVTWYLYMITDMLMLVRTFTVLHNYVVRNKQDKRAKND
jgi:hypothetical protein